MSDTEWFFWASAAWMDFVGLVFLVVVLWAMIGEDK